MRCKCDYEATPNIGKIITIVCWTSAIITYPSVKALVCMGLGFCGWIILCIGEHQKAKVEGKL